MWRFSKLIAVVFSVVVGAACFSLQSSEAVPTYVMLPLDTVIEEYGQTKIKDEYWLENKMHELRNSGVYGIMSDCWWGLVEKAGPRRYNFQPYIKMVEMARKANLKVQMVMSFHQCGTNVGDDCYIPLPTSWFTKDDVWYKTKAGLITKEYISLWADHEPLDQLGRTPLQMYADFLQAFKTEVLNRFPNVVTEIQVGAGPSGELRYPSYQLQNGRWDYCGVGEFTSYDPYAIKSLTRNATARGRNDWYSPDNAANPKCRPPNDGCSFFSDYGNNFASEYGHFFLSWYSSSLLAHGQAISRIARKIYGPNYDLSVKVAGVHWWYNTHHHGAELTAGYYNTNNKNAYLLIAESFKKNNIIFCFTCMEMDDTDNSDPCKSKSASLVYQTQDAVRRVFGGLNDYYAGENALPFGDYGAIERIVQKARGTKSFTYLRLNRHTDFGFIRELANRLRYA